MFYFVGCSHQKNNWYEKDSLWYLDYDEKIFSYNPDDEVICLLVEEQFDSPTYPYNMYYEKYLFFVSENKLIRERNGNSLVDFKAADHGMYQLVKDSTFEEIKFDNNEYIFTCSFYEDNQITNNNCDDINGVHEIYQMFLALLDKYPVNKLESNTTK